MRFTAPFLALTFILVWLAPKGALQPALFAWMLGTMLLYDTCYTIIGLIYSALLPEVTESDADRTGLQVSGSLFGLLGMLLGFIIPELFRPKAGASPSVLPLQVAMIVVGVVSALLIIATTLKVKERPEFTRVDKPLGVGPGDPLHLHQPIIPHPGRCQFYVDSDAVPAARHPLLPGRLRAANELNDRAGGRLHPADHRRARVEPDPGAAGGRPDAISSCS